MRIAIIGAAGKAGHHIATEATSRGHDVTGFGRTAREGVDRVVDVLDIQAADLDGFDAVVDALGFFTPETLGLHTRSLQHLADVLSDTATRLLVVGGAGSLYVDTERTVQLKDTPEFPEAFLALATAQGEQLTHLRERDDVAWTYVSPAADFRADGERTGSYALGGELFSHADARRGASSCRRTRWRRRRR